MVRIYREWEGVERWEEILEDKMIKKMKRRDGKGIKTDPFLKL